MIDNPLEIVRGDTEIYELNFADEDGAVIDITGWTIFMTVKVSLHDADVDAVISKTVTVHTSPTQGQTEITINPADTVNLTPGNYYYDLQVKTDDGMIKTILKGPMSLLYDVTQRTT